MSTVKSIPIFLLQNNEGSPKLSQQVEAQLKEAIEKQVFTQGENLPSENELCKIFRVSRSVVREALLILSAKGLIEISKGKRAIISKGKRAIVREPTIDNVLDSFSQLVNYKCGNRALSYILKVRKMIEPTVASLSAHYRNMEDIQKFEKYLQLMDESRSEVVKFSHLKREA